MPYVPTTALNKLLRLNKRIHGVQGGTSASKTISIIQILIDKCQRDRVPQLTSITSETVPHLKRGVMRDFKNIMLEHGYWDDTRWNATDYIYTFETGTPLEFFSLDMPHKVRGPRRKRLFINEANNVPYETFDQLEVRTEDEVWLDWNPVAEFWWHIGEPGYYDAVNTREDSDSIILTYKDNEGLPQSIVDTIERRKHNKNWWRVYGEGQLGEAEGRIYTGWSIVEGVPDDARLERYGLDFGYSNDPTAVVAVYKHNDGLVLDQILYQKGLSNSEIHSRLKNEPDELIIADSAEPKSIDELQIFGLNVIGSTKGQGSVSQGIQSVQRRKVSVTKRSVDLIKEYRNYLWDTDKNGRFIQKPVGYLDHALDAARYAISDMYPLDDDEIEKPKEARIPGTYFKSVTIDEEESDFFNETNPADQF